MFGMPGMGPPPKGMIAMNAKPVDAARELVSLLYDDGREAMLGGLSSCGEQGARHRRQKRLCIPAFEQSRSMETFLAAVQEEPAMS